MSRRLAGLLVLALVLLVAVLTPRIITSNNVSGMAELGTVAGPPTVGDCLVDAVDPAEPAPAEQPAYPAVTTRLCSGHRFGEVISVISRSMIRPPISADGVITDQNMVRCNDDMADYLGVPTSPDQGPPGTWSALPLGVRVVGTGPSDLQKAMGQKWIACVLYVEAQDGRPRTSVEYDRSANDSFGSGPPPAALSTCLRSADPGTAGCPVVVVDDGSAEPSEVAAVAAGARLLRHERARGPAAARNAGLRAAGTELVAFLDSDCVPEAGWLERLAGHLTDPRVGPGRSGPMTSDPRSPQEHRRPDRWKRSGLRCLCEAVRRPRWRARPAAASRPRGSAASRSARSG